jgi:arylformamidase
MACRVRDIAAKSPRSHEEAQMPGIDYEAEYNNRARVPEHGAIFDDWAREAERYRAETLEDGRAELAVPYGDTPRQILDLFLPEKDDGGPLALFLHGGYWRSLDPGMFSHLARGLNSHGVAVALAGYDLCPNVTISVIVGQIRRACAFLWQRRGRRIVVYGWSAGGHLAAAMAATDWVSHYPKAPADLVAAGYAISGIYDLTPLIKTSANEDLRLDPDEARSLSPLFWPLPPGRAFDTAVGALESSEFKRQSRALADAWRQGDAQTRYHEIGGVNHFTIVEALADPQSAMVARIVELAQRVRR